MGRHLGRAAQAPSRLHRHYDEVYFSPLQGATTVRTSTAHPWPRPDDFDYSDVAAQCERYARYARGGGSWGAILAMPTGCKDGDIPDEYGVAPGCGQSYRRTGGTFYYA